MTSKWEDMIIFCPNMIYFDMIYFLGLQLKKLEKSGFSKQPFLHKNLESDEFTDKKHRQPLCIP